MTASSERPLFAEHNADSVFQAPFEGSWAKLSRAICGVDERKVKDCKEDIDTILVFAGLFSAIMTAFLVQTYQSLQQNPMDIIISLLQQISTQHSDSTMDQDSIGLSNPQASTFQPTPNAIRINVLWFISLILSLVTASFGIIVKQWVREYVAGEDTSAQALLRIRHFRHPGLAQYRIFEIVAVLPLLLQLSLALFLIGLCFFTADVHSSIGRTTLPLVAAWGFLFLAVSSIPLWDPACPFKTPFLKALFNTSRRYLLGRNVRNEYSAKYNDENDVDILLGIDAHQADDQLLKNVLWGALQQAGPKPKDVARFLFKVLGHRMKGDVSSILIESQFLDLKGLPRDTCIAIMDMFADLVHREIAQLRIPADESSPDAGAQQDQNQWLIDSICILLSYADTPHSKKCNEVLRLCLSDGRHRTISHIIHTRIDADTETHTFLHIMRRLKGALALFTDYNELVAILDELLHKKLEKHPTAPRSQLHPSTISVDQVSVTPPSRRHTPQYKSKQLIQQFLFPWIQGAEETGQWTMVDCVLLQELVKASGLAPPAVRTDAVTLVKRLLLLEQILIGQAICEMALSDNKIWGDIRDTAQQVIIDAVTISTEAERSKILTHLNTVAGQQDRFQHTIPNTAKVLKTSFDPLHSCYFHLCLIRSVLGSGGTLSPQHWRIWSSIFYSIVLSLDSYPSTQDNSAEAIKCLELMCDLEDRLCDPNRELRSSSDRPSTGPSSSSFGNDSELSRRLLMLAQNQSSLDWRLQQVVQYRQGRFANAGQATRAIQGHQPWSISPPLTPVLTPLPLAGPAHHDFVRPPAFQSSSRASSSSSLRAFPYYPLYPHMTPQPNPQAISELDVVPRHDSGEDRGRQGGGAMISSSSHDGGTSPETGLSKLDRDSELEDRLIADFLNQYKPQSNEAVHKGDDRLNENPPVIGHPFFFSTTSCPAVLHTVPARQHLYTPTSHVIVPTPSPPSTPKYVPSELTQDVSDQMIPRLHDATATFAPTLPDWPIYPSNGPQLPLILSRSDDQICGLSSQILLGDASQEPERHLHNTTHSGSTTEGASQQRSPMFREHSTDEDHNDNELRLFLPGLAPQTRDGSHIDRVVFSQQSEDLIFRVAHGRDKGRALHSMMEMASSIDTQADDESKQRSPFAEPRSTNSEDSTSGFIRSVWPEEPDQLEVIGTSVLEGQEDDENADSDTAREGSEVDDDMRRWASRDEIDLQEEWRSLQLLLAMPA